MDRRRLAALLLTLSLAATGCNADDPEPRAQTTATPSPSESSASPTPTNSESALPITAVAAVDKWVRARNAALNTGDTTVLRQLTHARCSSCEPYIELIEDVYDAGGRYETRGWLVDNARELQPMQVTAAITMRGGVMVARADANPDEYEEDKAIFRFRLRPSGEGLVISFVGLIP